MKRDLLEKNFIDIVNIYEQEELETCITKEFVQIPDDFNVIKNYILSETSRDVIELLIAALNHTIVDTNTLIIEKGT